DAMSTLVGERWEVIDHTVGTVFDREGALSSFRKMLRGRDLIYHYDLVATLGDSLALARTFVRSSGVARGDVDVGPYESDNVALVETDAAGRYRTLESFRAENLGDAVVRLYERNAGLQPDGPAREGAAATACSMAGLLGPPDRWPFAPEAEAVDNRTVGFGSVRGRDAVLAAIGALGQRTGGFATRIDAVLALEADAILVRWTSTGTIHATGGAFERNTLMLWAFGADGLVTRWEQFDPEREVEALARFDALVGAPIVRRVRPNVVTA